MATFVLVHGAWSGAHGFRKIRPLLRDAGHEVYTPSLTGIGERSHLASPQVNLTTHIQDVVNTVLYEDLENIVLLGFSYGGMVVTGALQHIHNRISHLVYLDAFVPEDGDSADTLRGGVRKPVSVGQEWYMPPLERNFDCQNDTDWFGARRSAQPIASFAQKLEVALNPDQYDLKLSYIKASADENEASDSAFWKAAALARESEQWDYHEIGTNHMVAINRPHELAAILLGPGLG